MERIIVMAKNEVGVLADITAKMADASINILTVNTESTGDTGVVILTTEDNDRALDALTTCRVQGDHRRRAGHQAARRTRRTGEGSGEVQEFGREYTEPAHPRPPRRIHHSGAVLRRPRESGDVGGKGVHSLRAGENEK